MRLPARPLLVAALATAGLVVAGVVVLGGDGDGDSREEAFRTTPLSAFDPTSATVQRGAFCSDIDPRQVKAALGGEVDTERSWDNGDKVVLADGVRDVLHEYGCEYVAADGTSARAWVFAPPVDARQAGRLVRPGAGEGDCEVDAEDPFGTPSVGVTCSRPDGTVSATYRGLLGDAWLSCEVSAPAAAGVAAVSDRAGRWCVGVASAAAVV